MTTFSASIPLFHTIYLFQSIFQIFLTSGITWIRCTSLCSFTWGTVSKLSFSTSFTRPKFDLKKRRKFDFVPKWSRVWPLWGQNECKAIRAIRFGFLFAGLLLIEFICEFSTNSDIRPDLISAVVNCIDSATPTCCLPKQHYLPTIWEFHRKNDWSRYTNGIVNLHFSHIGKKFEEKKLLAFWLKKEWKFIKNSCS